MRRRDPWLLVAVLVTFALWLAAIGLFRTWARASGHRGSVLIGVAPSFFAGMSWTLWIAFATRTAPVASAIWTSALMVAAETAQLVLPGYTADVWDVVAGALGAAIVVPILRWRAGKSD